MRVISTLVIVLCVFSFSSCKSESIKLNLVSDNERFIIIHSVIGGELNEVKGVHVQGSCSVDLTNSGSGFYFVSAKNGFAKIIYLEKGSTNKIVVNSNKFSFEGDNAEENLFLEEWNKKYISQTEFYKLETQGKEKVQYIVDVLCDTEQDFLKRIAKFKNTEFYDLARLRLLITSNVKKFREVSICGAINFRDSQIFPVNYFSLLPDLLNDENILKVENGREWIKMYFYISEKLGNIKTTSFYTNGLLIDNDTIRSYYLADQIADLKLISRQNLCDINKSKQWLIVDSHKKIVQETVEKFKGILAGDKAADFTYPDVEGNKISLSDFKGKVVYIDVWATWCMPCRYQLSYLKKLEKELKGKDIEFISVSLDNEEAKSRWEKLVKKHNLIGHNLIAADAFKAKISKDYQITTLPRFIIIDREGRIYDPYAKRPSNHKLKKELLELLTLPS